MTIRILRGYRRGWKLDGMRELESGREDGMQLGEDRLDLERSEIGLYWGFEGY